MARISYRTARFAFGAIILTLAVAVISEIEPRVVSAEAAFAAGAAALAGLVASLLLVRQAWVRREREVRGALAAMANVDTLTGLKNRHSFTQAADRILQRSAYSHRPCVLVVWNLGGLPGINKEAGLSAGDRAIINFARILEASARPTDLVGRIGGPQFAAILAGGTKHTGMLLAARVGQQAWADWRGKGFTAACSTAAYPEDGSTLEQLFAAAMPSVDTPFHDSVEGSALGRGRTDLKATG
jgi:diguanylate cyclase (GGDEF)-like protein